MRHTSFSLAVVVATALGIITAANAADLTTSNSAPHGTPNFSVPIRGLTAWQLERFTEGKEAFEETEVAADGLGPVFNGTSCVQCHTLGGTGGASELVETRFGTTTTEGVFEPMGYIGGSLIQTDGSRVFDAVGCADCHVRTLVTGPSPVRALAYRSFAPYSDFLLHDMGGLGDGIAQSEASGREMRTAPLWGVRLLPVLMHDGRAHSLREAILAHDGQGRRSRQRFVALSAHAQSSLLAFLGTL